MPAVANSPGEFELSALSASTGWIPLFDASDDPCVTIRGTFVGTLTLQTSDQASATKTRTTTVTTYTAAAPTFALPRILGGWFRMIFTAYTSGTAFIGIGAPHGPDGTPVRLAPQIETNAPVGDSFS